MGKRKWLLAVVLSLTTLLLPGSVGSSQGYRVLLPFVGRGTDLQPPLQIAVLGDMSGAAAELGLRHRDGAMLAFEEWNAAGGVLGREIQWIMGDTKCSPRGGLEAARQVVERSGVRYILGAICSSASVPISEYTNPNRVLQITGVSANPRVTVDSEGQVQPYSFRACYVDEYEARIMGAFARAHLSAEVAAVLAWDQLEGMGHVFRDAFEGGGGRVVAFETFAAPQTDYSGVLSAIHAVSPDVLFVPASGEIGLIARQARAMGIMAVLLGIDYWPLDDPIEPALEGAYLPFHYSEEDPRPEVQGFISRYRARYGVEPDAIGALAYDAANVLVASIQRAGVDDTGMVKDVMAAEQHHAVTGTIIFDEYHNPIKNAAIMTIQGGELVFETSFRPD
jgi:branched-chain amino acid transport system substrate-binding protein